MSEFRKLERIERSKAEDIVSKADIVIKNLNYIFEEMDYLLDECGWDPQTWNISKAAMLVALATSEAAQRIIEDDNADEWNKELKEEE